MAQQVSLMATHELRPDDFAGPKQADEDWKQFGKKIQDIRNIPEVVRTKIYSAQGVVVWSDERKLVGARFGENPELREALEGKIEAEFSSLTKPEQQYERAKFKRAMELYVPITYPGMDRPVGVIELYQNVDHLFARIAQGQRYVWGVTLVGLVLLFVILFGLVRRASRTIQWRTQALEFLLETSKTVSASLSLEVILNALAHEMVNLIAVSYCQFFVLNEDKTKLCMTAKFPRRSFASWPELKVEFQLTDVPLFRRIMEQKEAQVLRRDLGLPSFSYAECNLLDSTEMNSLLLIPITSKGLSLGLVILGEVRQWGRAPFTREKIDLALGMAEQAGTAIDNAKLFEQRGVALESLIAALDAREHETQNHSQRVARLCAYFSQKFGFDQTQLNQVYFGALFHDIGKIGISDAILLKPSKLTAEEWLQMKKHPEIGYGILKEVAFLGQAKDIVLCYHEQYNEKGYPRGLIGDDISMGARIFSLIDTVDVITHDRPYRRARPFEVAKEEVIKGAGTQFDPKIVEGFLNIPEEEWANLLELTDKENVSGGLKL